MTAEQELERSHWRATVWLADRAWVAYAAMAATLAVGLYFVFAGPLVAAFGCAVLMALTLIGWQLIRRRVHGDEIDWWDWLMSVLGP